MEVLTIEHSAFQQLINKIDAMDEYIRKAKLEQQSSLDDGWVDGQAVCEYLCICDKTLQRLRSAGKITYSTIGNKYYYQIAEIKRCLRAHTIKSSDEMLGDLMQNGVYTPRKRRYENRHAPPRPFALGGLFYCNAKDCCLITMN